MESTSNLFLFGNHELSFDEKFRLSIPIEIRTSLDIERDGNAFFIVDGVNLRLWLWPSKHYRAMVSRLSSEMTPGVEKLEFKLWNFGSADFQEMDKQNRVRIPDKRVRDAGLNKEITLVGVQDHLELWNRPDWEQYNKELRARAAEIAIRANEIGMERRI